MLIDLKSNIKTINYAKVAAVGNDIEKASVSEIIFSKEALVGFAKNLIWIYEDIDKSKRFYVCTDPLGGVPSGNQIIGFYLATGSPILKFSINSLKNCYEMRNSIIENKLTCCRYIEISPPEEDDVIEEYELGHRNIAKILLYNKNNIDITENIYEVSFEINYEGLKNLAVILLKLADNYQEGAEYIFNSTNGSGIILTADSLQLKIKCGDLGNVYDYEPKYGLGH